MKLQQIWIGLTLCALGIGGNLYSQEGDGLDFLDKVDSIQIPKEKPVEETQKDTSQKTVSPESASPVKQSVKESTTKSTSTTEPVRKPITSKPATPDKTPVKSKTTYVPPKPTRSKPPVEKQEPVEETVESSSGIWVDQPLAMDPDYLPGFEAMLVKEEEPKTLPLDEKKETFRPDPVVTGDFSIWKSFTGFLSKYQKAFYIFGILLLFALYRLRSGRASSSARRSSPTIRRMRR